MPVTAFHAITMLAALAAGAPAMAAAPGAASPGIATSGAASPGIAIPGHQPVIVHGPLAEAREIIATELAFAAKSEASGPAAAMRAFMDKTDGLSFTGGDPARGAEAIYQAHGGGKPGGALTWYPSEVFAASGGGMGAVWGYFRFTPPGPKPATVTGRYVTVWRKQDGAWRGIIDIGNPD